MDLSEVRTELDGRQLTLSNLTKVLFPAAGFTKGEVIDYYLQVAPVLLPHLADRCLTRIRFPNGVTAASFYEKSRPSGMPEWVRTQRVIASGRGWGERSSTAPGEIIDYVLADGAATLVYLANLASLELHVPQWRTTDAPRVSGDAIDLDDPATEPLADNVVVDLDPGEGITAADSAKGALLLAGRLAEDSLVPWVKTSGNKGLQVYAPIVPVRASRAWRYVKDVAADMVRRHPDRFVATMTKSLRVGRIYIDYNQNLAARNTVAPYSLRAREHPSVSTPLTWEEVAGVENADDLRFSPAAVLARIEQLGDLAATGDHDRTALPTG